MAAAPSSASTSAWARGTAAHASSGHSGSPSAWARIANAASWAVTVLVAGTACSGPTSRSIASSAIAASGEPPSLVTATAAAPAAFTRSSVSVISGVLPDWLTPTAR